MSVADLILYDEEYRKIHALVEKLLGDSNARIVFLLDRNGQPVAHVGEMDGVDPTSLASLAAGNVAATEGLARLLGEAEFQNLYHEGEKDHLHLTVVANRMILVVIFDERSSLGLVRLRVHKASAELAPLIHQVERRTEQQLASVHADAAFEITDADLDALFSTTP